MNRNLPSAVPCNRRPPEDGTKYRVRDREGDPPTVWDDGNGQGLTYEQATIARDRVTAAKKSRSMVIEPMPSTPPVSGEVGQDDLSIPQAAPVSSPPHTGTDYQVASAMPPTQITADGVISKIPHAHQLLVNGVERVAGARVARNDIVECRSLAPAVIASRAAAADAVAQVMQQKRRVPMDVTVKQPRPRAVQPLPDRTVSRDPVVVRLGAPPATPPRPLASPLKVATLEDGDALPEDAITDADLPGIAGDLGGGPSDADVEHARNQAEAERTG